MPTYRDKIIMSVDMAVKVLDESLGKVVLIKLKGGKVGESKIRLGNDNNNSDLCMAEVTPSP